MCGIVGAVSKKNVVSILVEGLRRLEYRGYDSAGVAGVVAVLEDAVEHHDRVSELRPHVFGSGGTDAAEAIG